MQKVEMSQLSPALQELIKQEIAEKEKVMFRRKTVDIKNATDLPVVLNVPEVAKILQISRAGAYNLVNSEVFPVLKIGKRLLVPKDSFLKWIRNESEQGVK